MALHTLCMQSEGHHKSKINQSLYDDGFQSCKKSWAGLAFCSLESHMVGYE